jgi:tetratricopeptide (TPR) repeat protein
MALDQDAFDFYESCLVLIERGKTALSRSNLPVAEQIFALVSRLLQDAPAEHAEALLALTRCFQSLLEQRKKHATEATDLQTRAMPLVGAISLSTQTVPFHNLMLNVLIDLGEYRRAIPFCEQAIQTVSSWNDPLALCELLSKEGLCYSRCGLKEHAAVPLRAALKILRSFPGEPRLASVLISLGNVLHKTSPTEAEKLYKEAVDLYEAKAQMESATTVWANLGILCSRQGRHAESLGYYERALRFRESSPATPPPRIGSLLNNMANCYRRMGKIDEALQLVDRALGILKPEDSSLLASAYGTRGQILHEAKRDVEAVEWLQKSYAEREKSSSPDLEAIVENLEIEIASLQRLGRTQEAHDAEQKLAQATAAKTQTPQVDLDLSTLKVESAGAVLVELAFGSRPCGRYGIDDAEIVAEQLAEILAAGDIGSYQGRVVIPEATTLVFQGADGEAMFQQMEQYLADHAICAGATIAIRQGSKLREVVISQLLN